MLGGKRWNTHGDVSPLDTMRSEGITRSDLKVRAYSGVWAVHAVHADSGVWAVRAARSV